MEKEAITGDVAKIIKNKRVIGTIWLEMLDNTDKLEEICG